MLFAIPEMIRWTRRQKLTWLGWTAALWLPSWLVRPGWVGEWIKAVTLYAPHISSNLLAAPIWVVIGGLVAIPLVWWITKRRPSLRMATLFLNPAINSYNYALLAGQAYWIIIPASWIAQIAERYGNAHWAWGVVGLLATVTTLAPKKIPSQGQLPTNTRPAENPGQLEPGYLKRYFPYLQGYPLTAPPPSAHTIHVLSEINMGKKGSSDNPTIADAQE